MKSIGGDRRIIRPAAQLVRRQGTRAAMKSTPGGELWKRDGYRGKGQVQESHRMTDGEQVLNLPGFSVRPIGDLTGRRYGKLKVIGRHHSGIALMCRCACGRQALVLEDDLGRQRACWKCQPRKTGA